MKRFVFALAIAGALLGLGGCSGAMSEPPVTVEAKFLENMFYGNPIPVVEVTAITDSVEVRDVIANRGNCPMMEHRKAGFPHQLKFGQKATAGFTASCNLVEVEVVTDQGNWSFTFQL